LDDVGVFDRLIKDLSKKLFRLRDRHTVAFENREVHMPDTRGWIRLCCRPVGDFLKSAWRLSLEVFLSM
jgi:hypothetical protein